MKYSNIKILVISHNAFSKNLNNGKTLESLFAKFPKNNIAQLFFSQNEKPDIDFCENYFRITDLDVLKNLFSLQKKSGEKLIIDKNLKKTQNDNRNIQTNSRVWKFLQRRASYLTLFRDLLWSIGSWKTKKLYKWIDNFNPDVIFYCGGDAGFSHSITTHIKKKYNLMLVSYFTDDYLINPIIRNPLDWIQRKRMKKFYNNTVKNSTLLFAIGQLMAQEYSLYFQREFHSIMNSVSSNTFDRLQLHKLMNFNIKIGYFGGLHLNRWKMISHIGKILNEIIKEQKMDVDLLVYTNSTITEEIKENFNKNNIQIKEPLGGEKLIAELINTDILLHVESDERYYKSLTKLSVSTKIPEYLLTRNCIVAYGPIDVASIKLLNDNNIGIVINSSESNNIIEKKILEILGNSEFRKRIGENGYLYAKNNFDAESIRNYFTKKIEGMFVL